MTLLHPDPTQPARVDAALLPWDPSPAPGVERRRIERTGGEVARLTSIVRYAPGSRFPAHRHGGGEEYLVLSGTFSDEHGDHGTGSYVRNGVGSRHSPHTAEGCTILVKLWWMHPNETASAATDTTHAAGWQPTAWGARHPLHDGPHDRVRLLRLSPGATVSLDGDVGGTEVFIVDGAVNLDGEALSRWSWVRRPGDHSLRLQSGEGALLYVKSGHLAAPPALPGHQRTEL